MTFRARLRATTALVAGVGLSVAILARPVGAATTEELERHLKELEAMVLEQQKIIEAQTEKLEAQEDKLEKQEEKLEKQARQLDDQEEDIQEQKIWVSQQQEQIEGQGDLLYRMWETSKQGTNGTAVNGQAYRGGGANGDAGDDDRTPWIYAADSRIVLAQSTPPRPAPPVLDDEEAPPAESNGPRPPVVEDEGGQPTPPAAQDEGDRPRPPVVEDEGAPPSPPVVQDEGAPTPPAAEPERPRGPTTVEEERPEAEKPQEQALLERGAILLPPGTVQVEPSVEYNRFSSDRVAISGFSIFEAIIIGQIRVDDLSRDVVTGAVTARAGIFDRVQVDARVPAVYRRDTEILGVGTPNVTERSIQNFGIGDVSGGVSVQPIIGGGGVPDVIVRAGVTVPTGKHPFEIRTVRVGPGNELRLVEPPTGNGFYSIGGTATFVWSLDPVVLFTGGGYKWNMARDFGTQAGRVDPGDTIEFFAGTNVALSERVSLNLTFVNQRTGSTSQNGNKSPGSSFSDARLTAGTSISLSPSTSLLVSASAGLTDTAPDFAFTVSLPVTFDLF